MHHHSCPHQTPTSLQPVLLPLLPVRESSAATVARLAGGLRIRGMRLLRPTTDYSDIDYYADTTERDDSTSGTGHHTVGGGDSLTRTGDGITGTGPTATTTTTVTNAQLQAMIDQGVTTALAARDTTRNDVDSHTSGTGALTWWNSHVMTVTHDVHSNDFGPDLRKKRTDKYCNNQRVLRTSTACVGMFPEGGQKIERYSVIADMIHGNIVASKPKTMQEAVEMATELMDKRVSTIAER
ncbi:hypothetical protein Tco_0478128 [Tanacetum coccineum]